MAHVGPAGHLLRFPEVWMAIVALLWSMRSTDMGCDQLVTVTAHRRKHRPASVASTQGDTGPKLGVGTDEHRRLGAKTSAVAVTETPHPTFLGFFP